MGDPFDIPPIVMERFARDCKCCGECSPVVCGGVLCGGVCDRICHCDDEPFIDGTDYYDDDERGYPSLPPTPAPQGKGET